jgi:hypothetical protein
MCSAYLLDLMSLIINQLIIQIIKVILEFRYIKYWFIKYYTDFLIFELINLLKIYISL